MKPYHVNNKNIPNTACEDDDAKHYWDHIFCNDFNDELFLFCHCYIIIRF